MPGATLPRRRPTHRGGLARRGLSGLLAALLLAAVLVLVPRPAMARVPDAGVDRLEPTTTEIGGMAAAATAAMGRPDAPRPVRAEQLDVAPFQMIGVQLPDGVEAGAEGEVELRARVRRDGRWTPWQHLHVDPTFGPDGGDPGPPVTDPWWVADADAFQLLLPPGSHGAQVLVVREDGHRWVPVDATPPAGAEPTRPAVSSRAAWGAAPKRGTTVYADSLQLAVVHHTVSTNDYSPTQVPAMLRSIQAYHQDGNGWSDIGYNFLVDRFGRIWEGNGGGTDRPVVGGHAKGFNTGSVGVAVLGDLTSTPPTSATVDAVGRIIGWKMTISGVDPRGRVGFRTFGNERFAAGTVVDLPRIVGHRDTGSTSCPGAMLYARLGEIRAIAAEAYLTGSDPFGVLDAPAVHGPRTLRAEAWVIDPDASGPSEVHLYVDGVGVANVRASGTRADVQALWPWVRFPQRVSVPLPPLTPGPHQLCAYAIDQGQGGTQSLGCRQVVTPSGSPFGGLDPPEPVGPSTFAISGWSVDPDTDQATEVHVYVDGVGLANLTADGERTEVSDRYSGYSAAHGFRTVADLRDGAQVCAFAIDRLAPGGNVLLGCATARRRSGSPFGVLDRATPSGPGRVVVEGWAIDPDTTAPVEVHLYDETGRTPVGLAGVEASHLRPDLGPHFPGWGEQHGLLAEVRLPPGERRVCAYAIDRAAPGGVTKLGCLVVSMPAGAPIGFLDAIAAGPRSVRLQGWTLDPDVVASTDVHVYVDGRGSSLRASLPRPDVAAAFPGWDEARGFDVRVDGLAPGRHDACVFAIDVDGSANRLLECRTVDVPTGPPIGWLDVVEPDPGGGLRVAGWGLDPDTDRPVAVHVYVDGVGAANVPADQVRPDVGAAFPGWSDARGFSIPTPPLLPGEHVACVFLIDEVGGHGNVLLGCRPTVVPAP